MEKNPLNKGVLTENFAGIGPVTDKIVNARAQENALVAGHSPAHPTRSDREEAARGLAGDTEVDPAEARLEELPESARWDPVPGSVGHQAPESLPEDEDEEGRSESEQLAEEGVGEAEHDQMVQAARAAAQQERREP